MLNDLIWRAPVGKAGYALVKATMTGHRHESLVITLSAGATLRDYRPFHQESGLFLTFAAAEPTPDGCLAFVNRFGLLWGKEQESVALWIARLRRLRYLVELWNLARADATDGLAQFVFWDKGGVRILDRHLPEEADEPSSGPSELASRDGDFRVFMWEFPRFGLSLNDHVGAALHYVAAGLNAMLDTDSAALRLELVPQERRLRMALQSPTLLHGILWQFAEAISQDKRYQECPACGRWFEMTPALTRADRVTCSATCRKRIYRARMTQAKALHQAGHPATAIASQLGADLETIQGWIASARK